MKNRLLIAGLLFLATILAGCSGEEQPKEGSAEILKTKQTAEMSPEEKARAYKELGIDPNHPPTTRGGNNR